MYDTRAKGVVTLPAVDINSNIGGQGSECLVLEQWDRATQYLSPAEAHK